MNPHLGHFASANETTAPQRAHLTDVGRPTDDELGNLRQNTGRRKRPAIQNRKNGIAALCPHMDSQAMHVPAVSMQDVTVVATSKTRISASALMRPNVVVNGGPLLPVRST